MSLDTYHGTAWIRRFFRRREFRVSDRWIREQQIRDREDFHGVCWEWPVKKIHNESSIWNQARARKRA